ncbi:hypothetical protein [Chryseobacterium mucoviscidosis]|uniref:hypothetical protein n=1 Tax=Chryseobacterium mucoviscidosis TaxID=1945581 RepID=UPI0030182DD7
MSFFNKWKKTIIEFYFRFSIIIFFFVGIIFISISCFIQDHDSALYKFFYTIGSTTLSGGVFAVIAKSLQFSDIFSNILRDIIYGKEHLENRKDLENIWKNVTNTLSNQKFDKISIALQNNVKKYFLPLEHDYYYDNYILDITIEQSEKDPNYIIVKEIITHDIICEEETLEISYKGKCRLKCDYLKTKQTTYNLSKLEINGVNSTNLIKSNTMYKDNELFYDFEHKLKGKCLYTVRREDVKTYDVRYNKIKAHRANWIYNKFKIQIFYPQNLKMEFQNLGTLDDYKTEIRHSNGNTIFAATNNGVIYKNQGFIIVYS